MPNISFKNGEGDDKSEMSIAQRKHQFYKIGLRVINNCRQVTFLSSNDHLPKTVGHCKKIKACLLKQESGKKRELDIMMEVLVSFLSDNVHTAHDKNEIKLTFRTKILKISNYPVSADCGDCGLKL